MNPTDSKPDLSIVIPVGPGDESWRMLLPLLNDLPGQTEILISASGPAPGDRVEIAGHIVGSANCGWLSSAPGRAQQLNTGIEHSRGRWLWLLHADSRPDANNFKAVMQVLRCVPEGWFYFDLAFDQDRPRLTLLNTIAANLRSRLVHLPFGDQGWLITRNLLDKLGAFDTAWVRGEDLEWVMRARRHGIRPARIGERLMTSARRYTDQGWLKTTIDHQIKMLQMIHAARQQHRNMK